MEFFGKLFHTLIHLDQSSMNSFAHYVGPWLYVVLFAIIFVETGLIVMPFLPGDSLLFAVGALAAGKDSPINIWFAGALMFVAAVLGDAVNYAIGRKLGPKVFSREDSWLLNKKHLLEAQNFYDKYGGKTIILARFIPIVRTFAPFVAGIGRMNYLRFATFNVVGAAAWISVFLWAGWVFGTRPYVQKNFKVVIAAIIVVSVAPAAYELCKSWSKNRKTRQSQEVKPRGFDVIQADSHETRD